MPLFLTRRQLYEIQQRESPEDVYPEGPPTGFYATADFDATAKALASAYSNLEVIYDNYFPQHADEMLPRWEELYFGSQLSSSLSLEERQARVVQKVRTRLRPTKSDLEGVVQTILPEGVEIEIVAWGCDEGGWVLDESQLDISTYLNLYSGLEWGPFIDWCEVTAAELGITEEEYEAYRADSYTYEVRIYDYTLSDAEAETLERELLRYEPARSQHFISDGLDPADMIDGDS